MRVRQVKHYIFLPITTHRYHVLSTNNLAARIWIGYIRLLRPTGGDKVSAITRGPKCFFILEPSSPLEVLREKWWKLHTNYCKITWYPQTIRRYTVSTQYTMHTICFVHTEAEANSTTLRKAIFNRRTILGDLVKKVPGNVCEAQVVKG